MTAPAHIPVLLPQVLSLLDPQPGQIVLDCTAGLGGHGAALAERIGASEGGVAGTLILCDLDPANLEAAQARVKALPHPPRIIPIRGNFAHAPRRLAELGLAADAVLADLGFSSNQMESASRGLSFTRDGPLDMRLDPSSPITAAELVNTSTEPELAQIIADFGEERHARRIAQKLVRERRAEPIQTTARLAAIVRSVVGRRTGSVSIDPATRTFQALRIAVNDELGNLRSLLEAVERTAQATGDAPGRWLAPGARVAIIAFHSLEDRPVKQAFASLAARGLARALTPKALQASDEEVAANPRARSARLRAIRLAKG